jgi:hypothetical protein
LSWRRWGDDIVKDMSKLSRDGGARETCITVSYVVEKKRGGVRKKGVRRRRVGLYTSTEVERHVH